MRHQAKKRFGQNFLVDSNIIQRIIHSIQPAQNDLIIEIGPGQGALTRPLLEIVSQLYVIELDRDIIPILQHNIGKSATQKLCVYATDVLTFDFSQFHRQLDTSDKLRIIGNLPYNISTPILFHLLKSRPIILDMHFMLQKEVVERIAAPAGNRCYGRLSVMLQAYFDVMPLFQVPASAFTPAPKVESAILRLTPNYHNSKQINHFSQFETLVRTAFSQRRKTLRNTLKTLCTNQQIEAAGLQTSQRAEELSVADFIRLNQIIHCQKTV